MNDLARIIIAGRKARNPDEYTFLHTWTNLSFPHRPTLREIDLYRRFLGSISPEAKFLILGATPELRDLSAGLGIKPTLIDISNWMLSNMTQLTKLARPENETWIKCDWFEMAFPEGFFDVIVGDLFLRQLDPGTQEVLLKKIRRASAPGAKFIIRVHVTNPFYLKRLYKDILDEMSRFPYESREYEAMGILLSRLFDASTKNQKTDVPEIIAAVKTYISAGSIPFSYRLFLHEFLEKRLGTFTKPLASQTKKEIESLIQRYFSIIETAVADNYPEAEFYPIYSLVPARGRR